jgi:hypothetical protein
MYDPGSPRMLFIGAPRPFPAHGPQVAPTIPAPTGSGSTYYCAPVSSGSGTGSSPSNAAAFSQTALEAAGSGSVIVLAGSGNPANPTIYRCTTVAGSGSNQFGPATDQVIIGATTGVELRGSVVIGNGNIATWVTGTQSGTWTMTIDESYLSTDGYQSSGYGTAGQNYPALTYPEDLFWNGIWLDRVPSGTTLVAGQWTGDPDTGILVVFPPTAVNPNTVLTELSTFQNFGTIIQSNGAGDSITISNIVFNQFSGQRQFCVIDLTSSAGGSDTLSDNSLGIGKGWTVEYCEFKYCHSGAVFGGSYSVVQYNLIHDMGQQGIKGYNEAPAFRYNEIYNVNEPKPSGAQWDNTNEAGVGKFNNCHAAVFDYNWCHNIFGPGPWADYAYWDCEFMWNTMDGFDEQSFRIEMTNKAHVAYNLIRNTARIYTDGTDTLDGASSQALWLAQAGYGECHHNLIDNSAAGSGGILTDDQIRSYNWVGSPGNNGVIGDGTELYYSVPTLVGLTVHDNVTLLGAGFGHTGITITTTADFTTAGGTLDADLASSGLVTVTVDQPSPKVQYPIDQHMMDDPSTYPILGIDDEYLIGTAATVITVTGSKVSYTAMDRGMYSTAPAAHTAGAAVTAPNPTQSITAVETVAAESIFDHNVYVIPSAGWIENPDDGGTNHYGDYTKPFRGAHPTDASGVYAYTQHRYFTPTTWKSFDGQDAHSVFSLTGGANY